MSRSYSREEVDEILRRAAQRGRDGEPTLSRDELVDAARQAGIDPDAVHAAADEVETGVALERIPTDDEAVAAWQARRRRRFTTHVLTWLVMCTGLLVINLLAGGVFWFQWPLASWGILVALHAIGTFQSPTPDQVERVKARHRKKTQGQRRRLESERRKLEASLRDAEKQRAKEQRREDRARRQDAGALFEAAVEEGVAALLEVATRGLAKVAERSRPPPRKETEFDRYVARKKGQVAPEPQRVPLRVDANAGEPTHQHRVELEQEDEDEGAVPGRKQRR